MTKEEYIKALKSPKWKAKRQIILKRDEYKCVKCDCKENLHVHHTYYIKDKMPWEVPNDCLITLCKSCHKKEHEGKNISTFVRDVKKPKVVKTPKKVKQKKKSHNNLSKEDRELQKKYDDLKSKNKLPDFNYKPPIFQKKTKRKKKKP